ncbi:MAG: RND transporter [Halobacteriovoraceae bacterium]|nr:RND transporter [Halobacteriovoraceae bacterium]|tara:strand:+ start:9058 stop:10146 length:1089 start_codon:yes stop_codon:yes gene_type:complete
MNETNKKLNYSSLRRVVIPSWQRVFVLILMAAFGLMAIVFAITPWQQTSTGVGRVTAIDPNDRVQYVNAPVSGRINKWFVKDGDKVKVGDPIVEIVDNDPNFVERLKIERDAVLAKFEASKTASETAYNNFVRQKELYKQGLSSKLTLEKAQITYKKLLSEEASAAASLAKVEVKFSRQQRQLVTAERDGTVLSVLQGGGSVFVKSGDQLAVFVPDHLKPAVEIFVDGNDLPLIQPGRHVRLQFEGWPAVQFSGWPSIAVGTFPGKVFSVDPSVNKQGKFRVLIAPSKGKGGDWPDNIYLRQGTRVVGWVLLDTVKLGYELWRLFNGFPPTVDNSYTSELHNVTKKGSGSDYSDSDKEDKDK